MIQNIKQYLITKNQLEKFIQALANVKQDDPVLEELEKNALQSQCDELRRQIEEYDEQDKVTVSTVPYSKTEQLVFEQRTLFVKTEGKLQSIEDKEFGISIWGYTRLELLENLNDQIVMLWDEYAQEDDKNLTESTQQLKKQLLQKIRKEQRLPAPP